MELTLRIRLTCPLATAFEIIATASTIGTLHITEFMYNFDTCTLFHKERTIVLNTLLLALKKSQSFTFIVYIARNL